MFTLERGDLRMLVFIGGIVICFEFGAGLILSIFGFKSPLLIAALPLLILILLFDLSKGEFFCKESAFVWHSIITSMPVAFAVQFLSKGDLQKIDEEMLMVYGVAAAVSILLSVIFSAISVRNKVGMVVFGLLILPFAGSFFGFLALAYAYCNQKFLLKPTENNTAPQISSGGTFRLQEV